MRLSPYEQEVIRTRPQNSRLNLVVFRPKQVVAGIISDPSIQKGARDIHVDSLYPTGTIIEPDTTLLIGTSSGCDDVGRIRIRSASFDGKSGTFTVSENSNIQWSDGMCVTAYKYWEVWPVFPRIIQDPDNEEDVIFYKDYDIDYTDQNSRLGTFIHMGSHRARTLDGGSANIYWTSSGSVNLRGESLAFTWEFEGGTPTGSLDAEPGYIEYTEPGDYVTKLTATSASGTVDVGYRYVAIRDKIGEGDYPPIIRWEMKNFRGSRDEGGWSADFVVYDDFSIRENSVVMLVADDWYGNQNVSLGGNSINEPYMFFVGHIEKGTLKYDYKHSKVEFTAVSIARLMKDIVGFSVSIESKSSPSTWYELIDMDCRRALYHYLRWHSTVLQLSDFEFKGTDYKIQFFDADRTSLFDSIDELMRGTLVGTVCSDRQGGLYAEVSPKAYPNPTGAFEPIMEITRRDWLDEPSIDKVINDKYSYMEYGGIQFLGPDSGQSYPFLSCAPGTAPSFRGNVEKQQGLALGGQNHLNTLIGNIYAHENAKFPTIDMDMTANFRNLDVAPYEFVHVRVEKDETVLDELVDGMYTIDGMSWKYDHKNGTLLPSLELRAVVNGFPGDTLEIPIPDDGYGSPSFPPINITPIAIPPLVTGTTTQIDPEIVVLTTSNFGVLYTDNFQDIAPVWKTMNEGFASGDELNVGKLVTTRTKKLFAMTTGNTLDGYKRVYKSNGAGQPWELVWEVLEGRGINAIQASKIQTEFVLMLHGQENPTINNWVAVIRTWNSSTQAFNDNPVCAVPRKGFYRAEIVEIAGGDWIVYTQHPAGFQGIFYQGIGEWLNSQGSYYVDKDAQLLPSVDQKALFACSGYNSHNALYWTAQSTPAPQGIYAHQGFPPSATTHVLIPNDPNAREKQSAAMSPSGQRAFASDYISELVGYVPYRSTDGGVTWESWALMFPSGMSCFENINEDRWLFGGGTNMKYTKDFGITFENKEGNLSPSFPLVDITQITYVG